MSANLWKQLNKTENSKKTAGIQQNITKINEAWIVPQWVYPPNLSSIWSALFLQRPKNCSTNQRPGNGENSMEHDKKLIRFGKSHNEFSSPTKFELGLISSLSAHAWKLLDLSKAKKWQEFSKAWPGAWPNVDKSCRVPWWVHPPNLSSIQSVVCLQMHRICSTN